MRVWAASDLHTDYKDNMAWYEQCDWLLSGPVQAATACMPASELGQAGKALQGRAVAEPLGWICCHGNPPLLVATHPLTPAPIAHQLSNMPVVCRAERLAESGDTRGDCLIVAGDVSDDLSTFRRTMEALTRAFAHVFFVPGNHDLWCRKAERELRDSLGKLALLEQACAEAGVHTRSACVQGVWIVPLLSWYHASWDREPDLPGSTPIEKASALPCVWNARGGVGWERGRRLSTVCSVGLRLAGQGGAGLLSMRACAPGGAGASPRTGGAPRVACSHTHRHPNTHAHNNLR